MSYKSRTFFRLIEDINASLFLPHIPRAFVWEVDQICRLFDSLMRNHPIQTFLFWKTKDYIKARKFVPELSQCGGSLPWGSPAHGSWLRELFDRRRPGRASRQKFWIIVLFPSMLLGFLPLAWPYLASHDSLTDWSHQIEPVRLFLLDGLMPLFLLLVITVLIAALLRAFGLEVVSKVVTRNFKAALGCTIVGLALVWTIVTKWSLARLISPVDPFYAERAINFSDGVSPLLPTVLLAAALSCWCFSQLSRLHLLERFSVASPLPINSSVGLWQQIQKQDGEVRDILEYPYRKSVRPSRYLGWAFLIAVLTGNWLFYKGLPSLESDRIFGLMARSGFIFLACLLICTWFQVIDFWKHLQQLLRELAKIPLAIGYARLPEKVSSFFGRYLDSRRDRSEQIRLAQQQLQALVAEYPAAQPGLSQLGLCLDPRIVDDWRATKEESSLYVVESKLRRVCQECCRALWTSVFRRTSVDEGYADPPQVGTDSEALEKVILQKRTARLKSLAGGTLSDDDAGKSALWIAMAEEFIAIQIVRYISQFFVHLKRLMVFMVVTVLLLLLGVSSYPFQPQRLAIGLLAVAIAAILGVTLVEFIQIDRDEIVSRIAKTMPHKFTPNWAFVSNFMTYAVPLLGVLAAQLAGGSDLIRTWMESILRLVR